MNDRIKKLINPTWTAIAVLVLSIVIVIFASRLLYQRTVDLLTENLRERILTISITAASNISSNDLAALREEKDWEKPEWAMVVNQLHKAKYSNDKIVFMYIFRKKTGSTTDMEFVADADSIDPYANTGDDPSRYVDVNRDGKLEPDGPDKLQWPGQPFPEIESVPEAYEAYNGPLTTQDLYTDEYGTVLTGFAPIKDENGNTVAILGTDIKADDFATITKQTLEPFLIFIAFLTSVISFLVIFIIYAWRKYMKSLEALNAQIVVANQNLQELIKQRESLMHLINHKVKGAFTHSKYIFAGILDGTFGEITTEIKKSAEQGLESNDIGIKTVDLVLNAANLQKGTIKYDMKTVDLQAILETIIAEKQGPAEEKGLKIEKVMGQDSYTVLGDTFWLKEALNNLIDNSVKYTKSGKITVGLEKKPARNASGIADAGGDMKVLVSVKDTGMGITPEDKKVLFTEGGRGKDSAKVNVDSTGYGLYSVKLIVDAHKGKVWAESEGAGKGSAFFVELPTANLS